ncbi:MAG: accessory factor UbiK family protein [Nitrosomonadales bacterium]|nr:accessory factor UbiK family protein [Nitrosomonadales bacterium]
MFKTKILDELSGKVGEVLASGPAKDVEKNVRALLAQGFSKLDLVTREEFEVQSQLLARTQEKLAALEARIAELEARASADAATPRSPAGELG